MIGYSYFGGGFEIMFFLTFALIIGVFIVTFVSGISQWNKNNQDTMLHLKWKGCGNMKRRTYLTIIVISIMAIVIGYFLSAILIPIQDIELLGKAELVELQKDLSINYWLGKVMIYTGMIGIVAGVIGRIQFERVDKDNAA